MIGFHLGLSTLDQRPDGLAKESGSTCDKNWQSRSIFDRRRCENKRRKKTTTVVVDRPLGENGERRPLVVGSSVRMAANTWSPSGRFALHILTRSSFNIYDPTTYRSAIVECVCVWVRARSSCRDSKKKGPSRVNTERRLEKASERKMSDLFFLSFFRSFFHWDLNILVGWRHRSRSPCVCVCPYLADTISQPPIKFDWNNDVHTFSQNFLMSRHSSVLSDLIRFAFLLVFFSSLIFSSFWFPHITHNTWCQKWSSNASGPQPLLLARRKDNDNNIFFFTRHESHESLVNWFLDLFFPSS